jgi:hypothetical protein
MGQVIMVVESGRTTQNTTQQALALIESCPAVMMVLNKSTVPGMGGYYGYYANAGNAGRARYGNGVS